MVTGGQPSRGGRPHGLPQNLGPETELPYKPMVNSVTDGYFPGGGSDTHCIGTARPKCVFVRDLAQLG